ncbi:unnamed protein product [Chilo suppressalis]|uniref:EF-hand domain-containing protein n=1 Tax=Chilo suppressalis TaxID=168631 RepID=A0ABN8B5F6_CHISP|nr:hypothetical protein evm_007636 [Chilo suppressalis]CAH0401328.1 unnamed protein product [Chilo suppressalis]
MGSSQSYPGLTEDVLEDYISLTYLSKGEILHLMKKFYSINPQILEADFNHRFHKDDVIAKFGTIKNNPFRDRLFRVFSSKGDDYFSFEDLLDLCSVMSHNCPADVKAVWAFRIFDLDEDKQISDGDISKILDRLTACEDKETCLDEVSKEKIAKEIIKEMNLDGTGSISISEFKLIMARLPEFESSFYFRL